MRFAYPPDRLRTRLAPIGVTDFFRIFPARYAATPLGIAPASSRFSDPGLVYPVLYGAHSIGCALWEAVLRDRFGRTANRRVAAAELSGKVVARISSTEPLVLLDLRGDAPVRLGLPTAVVRDRRHRAGQALSRDLYHGVPESDGVLYHSRFTDEPCVAVFDRGLTLLRAGDAVPLMEQTGTLDALDDFDIEISTEAP